MSFLSNQLLCVLLILLGTFAASLQLRSFLRVVTRMRWLFLSILIIYGLGTPGEFIPHIPVNFAPTFEGVQQGMLQIVKLLIALAALSLLFSTSSKAHLIHGLYILLSPLKFLGLNVKRFAVRLLLTLDYVEELASQQQHKFSLNQFDDIYLTADEQVADKVIVFESLPFNFLDKVMMFIFMGAISGMLVLGFQS